MPREAPHCRALPFEAHRGRLVELAREHLHRDLAVESDLACSVDRAVAAATDEHRVGDALDGELDWRGGELGRRGVHASRVHGG